MCFAVSFDTGETREPLCGLGAVPAPAGTRLCSRHGVGTGPAPAALSAAGKAERWGLPPAPCLPSGVKGGLRDHWCAANRAGASSGSSAGTVILLDRYEGDWGVRVDEIFNYAGKVLLFLSC